MKKNTRIILIGLVIIACGSVYWKIESKMHNKIVLIKDKFTRYCEYKKMHEPKVDVTKSLPMTDEANAWYTKYHIISHAGGAIDGRTYTNSLEAWNYSYSRGNRVMDADLAFTPDEKMILLHGWYNNIELQANVPMKASNAFMDRNGHVQYLTTAVTPKDFKMFMHTKIFHLYTPMSCETMLQYMQTHPDLYVATDMKDDVVKSYSYIVKKAKDLNLDSVLSRIIVNLYDYDMYDKVMKVYPFSNTTMRQHYVHPNNYSELVDFCLKHKIHVVNISSCYMDDEGVKLLLQKGIRVYVAVVDYISDMQYYRKKGCSGCVSNFLYEDIYNLSIPQ